MKLDNVAMTKFFYYLFGFAKLILLWCYFIFLFSIFLAAICQSYAIMIS